MKRTLSLALCLLLTAALFASPALAEYAVYGWNGDLQYGLVSFTMVDVVDCADNVTSVSVPAKVYSVGVVNYAGGFPVKGIGEGAFKGHTTVSSVTLEDSIERIESQAFANCKKLASLTVKGASVTIAADAFSGSSKVCVYGLKGSSVEAFCASHNIRFAVIGSAPDPSPDVISNADPDTVLKFTSQSSGGYAVSVKEQYAGKIGSIALPAQTRAGKKIVAIAEGGFRAETGLTDITFSQGLTRIGDNAFRECANLKSAVLPEGLVSLGEYAFRECRKMTGVTLPSTLREAGHCAFAFCDSLERVSVSGSLKTLPEWMFCEDSSLREVTLQGGISKIDNYAFYYCTALRTLTIPSTVTAMNGSEIFEGCSSALVLRGATGSEAERYARQYGLTFEATTDPDPEPDPTPAPGGDPVPVPVRKITLSQKKASLLAGRAPLTLVATVTPPEAAGQELVWTSGKPAVATVAEGVVTPLMPGKTTITCKAASGKAKATCVVTVKPVPVENLAVEPLSLSLKVGESARLTASVAPADATYKTPVFKSSKAKIASVAQDGTVTAVKAGKAVITVSVKGSARKVKVPVTVEGGGGGKLTASVSSVTPRSISLGRSANGVIHTVNIQFSVQSVSGGTARVRKASTQTSFQHADFAKYDFDVSEDIALARGETLVNLTFYAAPWTYMGSDTPLLIRLTVSGKNGDKTPLSYKLPLYAVKLADEW